METQMTNDRIIKITATHNGGGGFFLAREKVRPFISCLVIFFFFMEITSRTLIPFFRLGSVHSGSGSWDDCGGVFPD